MTDDELEAQLTADLLHTYLLGMTTSSNTKAQ